MHHNLPGQYVTAGKDRRVQGSGGCLYGAEKGKKSGGQSADERSERANQEKNWTREEVWALVTQKEPGRVEIRTGQNTDGQSDTVAQGREDERAGRC